MVHAAPGHPDLSTDHADSKLSMSPDLFAPIGFFVVIISATGLLLSRGWRSTVILLAIQYIGVFFLVATSWQIEQAFIKLITGWIVCAVIGLVFVSSGLDIGGTRIWPAGRIFRVLVILLTLITVWSVAPAVSEWIPGVGREVLSAGLLLITMGILQFSLGSEPFYIIIGLLTFMSGFEVVYAGVESSVLITGLMAGVNLLLALIGSYLIALPGLEQET